MRARLDRVFSRLSRIRTSAATTAWPRTSGTLALLVTATAALCATSAVSANATTAALSARAIAAPSAPTARAAATLASPANARTPHFPSSLRPASTESSPPAPHTIFAPGDSVLDALQNDGQPIEVGMKFRAETDGVVTAVRFYKQPGNGGVHIGHLWSASGALLAEATFDEVTAAGWQTATFSIPVALAAGTTCTISCFSADGNYSATPYFFTTDIAQGPLTALGDASALGNGVYTYTTSPAFPALSWQACNYWVDVQFVSPQAPMVLLTAPLAGAIDAPVPSDISVRMSAALDPTSLNATTCELRTAGGTPVAASVSYDSATRTIVLHPVSPLAVASTYTARLRGGSSGAAIRGTNNIAMPDDFSWSFTTAPTARPEPRGWVAGDPHVHRSCGGTPVSMATIHDAMVAQDIDIVALLADMGNGEVQSAAADLPQVNDLDAPVSTPGRTVHWDAEWHWDAVYSQYSHQALGGHILGLGLSEAHTIWDEATGPIIAWAHDQGGIAGFAHMQYLDEGIPQTLSCCAPIEYPVEVALGSADFISEDVNGSDAALHHWYRLLNCGFRPGFAAGSDFPCESSIGRLLTYAETPGGANDYKGWVNAIAHGRTVISRKGRNEFLALRVNNTATPGDDVALSVAGSVQVSATWTSRQSLSRTVELVCNGVVVASKACHAAPGAADSITATLPFARSGWVCARVMGPDGHEVHTGAVYVTVAGGPVRASALDAQFYVQWLDQLILKTSPGGEWNGYFETSLVATQVRYQAARTVFQQIAAEAGSPLAVALPASAPQALRMGAIHPNPSRGALEIPFTLPRGGAIRLALFDLAGRRVRQLLDQTETAGTHRVTWDGLTEAGQPASTGVYLVRCESGGQIETRRIQLLR